LDKISDYKAIIADQIKSRGYDIGVVCLNAGTFANLAPFGEISDQAVQDMCNINVSHVIYCIKTLLPLMTNRKQVQFASSQPRCALILTSSQSSIRPFPMISLYAASKVFVTYLAQALSYELSDKVDVFSYEPGYVETNMTTRIHDTQ
jgi:short-subunit dehydrogenase